MYRYVWWVQDGSKINNGSKGKVSLRIKVKEDQHYTGIEGNIGMKAYLHGPMDHVKKLKKLRFCVGDLDLPEERCVLFLQAHHTSTYFHRCRVSI